MFSFHPVWLIPALLASALPSFAGIPSSSFTAFESGQVRPISISPNGRMLVAVNTPDNRIEIFRINAEGVRNAETQLSHSCSVPVGMEPVAVAVRTDQEIWVVNHLSDSVSIVRLENEHCDQAGVAQTLFVGDEPRDIVFAGDGNSKAFITTAHRGQNSPIDPQLTTPGIGRGDVWIFDTNDLGQEALGGEPASILTLFSDTPRALTVSPDGRTVYAAGFQTGNQTTVIDEGAVCDGGEQAPPCQFSDRTIAYGLPGPDADSNGNPRPEEGLIVKFDGKHWVDELQRIWDQKVPFSLPDKDVFKIDASANPPQIVGWYQHVGTVLYNMIVNPVNGKVYVSNTEARNEVRFEGVRPADSDLSSVIGHLHETRISILGDENAFRDSVLHRHLNKHIDYDRIPAPTGTKDNSLALPRGMAISPTGDTLYLAAKGSSKIGVFKISELEDDSFVPNAADHIRVSGGGPTGLALSKDGKRLFALTRFNNAVVVIDTDKKIEVESHSLFNPEPASLVAGRPYLYDAYRTSSNGEAACGSCHVDGDVDQLAWDLGDPLQDSKPNRNVAQQDVKVLLPYHPMKGPMTTQSIRGIRGHGSLHWRGDRTAADQGEDPNDVVGAFKAFNPAFVSLMGRDSMLSDSEMQLFAEFAQQIAYPPNPIRSLDNSLTPDQKEGRDIYFNYRIREVNNRTCNSCHRLDPEQGLFGTNTKISNAGQSQQYKIPHFRNMYTKVGMFGRAITDHIVHGDDQLMGDQIRGFGFLHNGAVDTVFRTLFPIMSVEQGRKLEQFILAFDSNLAPIVGQQVTLTNSNFARAQGRIDLMVERADAGECDLIAKARVDAHQRGWYRRGDGLFVSDLGKASLSTDKQLRNMVARGDTAALTYTCTPPGSGVRMGVDRDLDGLFDSDAAVLSSVGRVLPGKSSMAAR